MDERYYLLKLKIMDQNGQKMYLVGGKLAKSYS